ncbi:MAG: MinD/ParA family protein [Planctomycetota bacterium]|nr:MAG: MinD/ParA family protein [Planctomycetota bacterium]
MWAKLADGARRLVEQAAGARGERDAARPPAVTPLARVVSVASGKGGTGKSILSTNLACQLARAGERVVLIDCDTGWANDHLLLGLQPSYDLGHVAGGQATVLQSLVPGPGGLRLLSGGVGRARDAEPTWRDLDRLFHALVQLETSFDVVIVDHGAGLGLAAQALIAAGSALVIVTGTEVTALSDGYAAYKRAVALAPAVRAGLVVNKVASPQVGREAWERFSFVSQRFLERKPELLALVPDDRAVVESVEKRLPVVLSAPTSPAAQAIAEVARWEPFRVAAPAVGGQGVFERSRRALR